MLSAKLSEGKIRIIDSEKVEAPKTKLVAEILKQFDPKYRILVLTSYKTDPNFQIAQENIQRIEVTQPHVRMAIVMILIRLDFRYSSIVEMWQITNHKRRLATTYSNVKR